MRRARQERQRIARLFHHDRLVFRQKRSFGLAVCLRSDRIPLNRCPIRRFRIKSFPVFAHWPIMVVQQTNLEPGVRLCTIQPRRFSFLESA
jgi:hypothetical protein